MQPTRWILFLAVAVLAASAAAADAASPKLRRASDFALPDWQGKTVRLSDYRGQVVVLQFFRTGCPICRQEAPMLEQLYQSYRSKGVVVVGISHEDGATDAFKKYVETFGITHPLLVGDLEVAVRYLGLTPQRSSFNTPHFFLINQEGYIVREFIRDQDLEFFSDERRVLEEALTELLAGQRPQPR